MPIGKYQYRGIILRPWDYIVLCYPVLHLDIKPCLRTNKNWNVDFCCKTPDNFGPIPIWSQCFVPRCKIKPIYFETDAGQHGFRPNNKVRFLVCLFNRIEGQLNRAGDILLLAYHCPCNLVALGHVRLYNCNGQRFDAVIFLPCEKRQPQADKDEHEPCLWFDGFHGCERCCEHDDQKTRGPHASICSNLGKWRVDDARASEIPRVTVKHDNTPYTLQTDPDSGGNDNN